MYAKIPVGIQPRVTPIKNMASIRLVTSEEKILKMLAGDRIPVNLNKGQRMTLTLSNIMSSFARLVYIIP